MINLLFILLKRRKINFCALLFLLLPSWAMADFYSVHQKPLRYIERVDVVDPIYSDFLVGFEKQYAPYEVSGCVIGYPQLRGLCQTVTGGFGFGFPNYWSEREFKVFIPGGTKFFSMIGGLAPGEMYAVVARLGRAPDRIQPLSYSEYEEVVYGQKLNHSFEKDSWNKDMFFAHIGGGTMSLAGTARMSPGTMGEGEWLYIRVLNGGSIYNASAAYTVDRDVYKSWYDEFKLAGKFKPNGDPIEGGSIPPITPPLNAITVSPTQGWTVGTSPVPSIRITAEPANAKIKACQVKDAKYLDILKFSNFTGSTVSGSINTDLAQTLPSGSHRIEFTCDNKDGEFTINKPVIDPTDPTEGTVTFSNGRTVTEPGEFQGEYEMTMSLDLANEKIRAGDKVSYWVAALIPFYGPVLPPPDQNRIDLQVPFFLGLTDPGSERRRMWRLLLNENQLANSVYAKNVSPVNGRVENTIQLYISEADLRALGAEIVIGYKITRGNQEGPIKAASGSWQPAPNPTASAALQ